MGKRKTIEEIIELYAWHSSEQHKCKCYCCRLIERNAELKRDVKFWQDAAKQNLGNTEFYRDIVHKIGELFGDAAKTADDGSIMESVLALKVYPLVDKLMSKCDACGWDFLRKENEELKQEVQDTLALYDSVKPYTLLVESKNDEIERWTESYSKLNARAAELIYERDTLKQKVREQARQIEFEQKIKWEQQATIKRLQEVADALESYMIDHESHVSKPFPKCRHGLRIKRSLQALKQACADKKKWTLEEANLDDDGFDKPEFEEKEVCPNCEGERVHCSLCGKGVDAKCQKCFKTYKRLNFELECQACRDELVGKIMEQIPCSICGGDCSHWVYCPTFEEESKR